MNIAPLRRSLTLTHTLSNSLHVKNEYCCFTADVERTRSPRRWLVLFSCRMGVLKWELYLWKWGTRNAITAMSDSFRLEGFWFWFLLPSLFGIEFVLWRRASIFSGGYVKNFVVGNKLCEVEKDFDCLVFKIFVPWKCNVILNIQNIFYIISKINEKI